MSEPGTPARSRLGVGLGIDWAFSGDYVVTRHGEREEIRLDLLVTDSGSGEVLAAAVEAGPLNRLPETVTLAVVGLCRTLGLRPERRSMLSAADRSHGPSLSPAYFRGLLHLERFEAEAARERLTRATEEAPGAPWPRLALAEARTLLGYDRDAAQDVDAALELAGALEGENRLWLEARAFALVARWGMAVDRLEALWLLQPDNLEYGLELASTLLAAGRAEDASGVHETLSERVPAAHQDPRIHLVASETALALGRFAAAIELSNLVIEQARDLRAPGVEARGLHAKARALHNTGRTADALSVLETSRLRFELAGDVPKQAAVSATLSRWLSDVGDYRGAEAEARRALERSRKVGDRGGEAEGLSLMGFLIWQAGRREAGEADLRQALEIYRQIGDRSGEAATLRVLGIAFASFTGGTTERFFEQALTIYRELGQRERISRMLINIGRRAMLGGDLAAAVEAFEEARSMVEVLEPSSRALIAFNLGYVQRLSGDPAGALSSFRRAVELFGQLNNPRMLATSLEGLGGTELAVADVRSAVEHLRSSLQIHERNGEPIRIARAKASLARALLEAGEHDRAEHLVREALQPTDAASSQSERLSALGTLALVLLETGRIEDARRALPDAPTASLRGKIMNTVTTRITIARVLGAAGEHQRARELLEAVRDYADGRQAYAVRLEADLAMVELAERRGDPAAIARIDALADEARHRGLTLLAQKAEGFRRRLLSELPPGAE